MQDQYLRAKCKNILIEYEDVLRLIVDAKVHQLNTDNKLGNTEFDIVKNTIFNAGMREGMNLIILELHKHANS